jgi:hypothetical protein
VPITITCGPAGLLHGDGLTDEAAHREPQDIDPLVAEFASEGCGIAPLLVEILGGSTSGGAYRGIAEQDDVARLGEFVDECRIPIVQRATEAVQEDNRRGIRQLGRA